MRYFHIYFEILRIFPIKKDTVKILFILYKYFNFLNLLKSVTLRFGSDLHTPKIRYTCTKFRHHFIF